MTETAVAVINASAIRHNFERIKTAAAGCRIMAVIKANAYGHGLIQAAQILSDADAFAVARVDEGASLRVAGIRKPNSRALRPGIGDTPYKARPGRTQFSAL